MRWFRVRIPVSRRFDFVVLPLLAVLVLPFAKVELIVIDSLSFAPDLCYLIVRFVCRVTILFTIGAQV